jgi:glycosyltransferase involved in cell wall biosynthesis
MAEIIRDGIDGFLIEPKNPEKLADCIANVLGLPLEKKNEIRLAAQERVRSTFDMSIIVPQMMTFYEETITNFPQRKSNHS